MADITSKEALGRVASQLEGTTIDALVTCSGLGGVNQWEEVIQTNLTGTYYFVNAFLPFPTKKSTKV